MGREIKRANGGGRIGEGDDLAQKWPWPSRTIATPKFAEHLLKKDEGRARGWGELELMDFRFCSRDPKKMGLMKTSVLICALILLAKVDGFTPPPASTLTQPPPSFAIHSKSDDAPSFNPALGGGGGGGASGAGTTARAPVLQDYTAQSLALFQALLTPSTLLSGAVYR